jgi:cellulose synthase operon protein YhjQ
MYSQPATQYVPSPSATLGTFAQSLAASPLPGQAAERNPSEPPASRPIEDTVSGSHDRVASRWFALKGVFDPHQAPLEQAQAQPPAHIPALAVFSLAGGVGKTSLVASLGRALSSRGERVVLVDTAAFGLLPFYFGARDQRPGILRTFNPPGVSADAPIQVVTIDPDAQPNAGSSPESGQNAGQAAHPDWLAEEVVRYTRNSNRLLIDLPTASGSTTRRILRLSPVVLVPVLADMNSVVSVGAIESFFRSSAGGHDSSGKPILPYYVLNQFDYSLPLHLDVREILRDRIGERLLPFALRRSPAVSEALAEGMTVMDYAPSAVIAEDYANLAGWVRSLSAPATQTYRGVRWSER